MGITKDKDYHSLTMQNYVSIANILDKLDFLDLNDPKDNVKGLIDETSGLELLSKALEVNKTITEIYLGCNRIGDIGLEHLSKALEVNKTITTIKLSYNNIKNIGLE